MIKLLRFIRVACTIQIPGLVNVDFADVRAIMANAGSSLMGIGTATGKRKTNNFFQVSEYYLSYPKKKNLQYLKAYIEAFAFDCILNFIIAISYYAIFI